MRRCRSGRKILSLTVFILLLAMLLSSCGQGADPAPQDPGDDPDPAIEEPAPSEPIETPSPMEDADENRKLVCVNVNNLRVRNAPAGDILYELFGDKEREKYAQRIAYEYFEEAEADGYRWLRIGDGEWIATKPEWITESYYGENFSMDDPDARIEFEEGTGFAPNTLDRVTQLLASLGQDETQISLTVFLKKTMPGLLYDMESRLIDFDINELTDEMRDGVFHQLFFHGPAMGIQAGDHPELKHVEEEYASVLMNTFYPDVDPDEVIAWGSYPDGEITMEEECYGNAKHLPIVLEEHMNFLSYKYYGKMIDFRTCTDMLLYDPIDHAFAVLWPYGYGYGAVDTMPLIESYSIDGNLLTALVAPVFVAYGTKIIGEDFGETLSIEEAIALAKQKAEVTVRITEDGGYQLLKVDVLD